MHRHGRLRVPAPHACPPTPPLQANNTFWNLRASKSPTRRLQLPDCDFGPQLTFVGQWEPPKGLPMLKWEGAAPRDIEHRPDWCRKPTAWQVEQVRMERVRSCGWTPPERSTAWWRPLHACCRALQLVPSSWSKHASATCVFLCVPAPLQVPPGKLLVPQDLFRAQLARRLANRAP